MVCKEFLNIKVGIPTINRADLLQENLSDLAENFPDLDWLYILDNGNQGEAIQIPEQFISKTDVIRSPTNLGVAESWNVMAENAFRNGADYILLLNDDIVFGKTREQIEGTIKDSNYSYFINNNSWSSFYYPENVFK